MSDKIDFRYIKTKLDLISKTLLNIHKEISYETLKINKVFKKKFHKPSYLPEDSKKLKKNTSNFFIKYLKPHLEREVTFKRDEIIKQYKKQKEKSELTIGNYLRELERKNYILSERDTLDGKSKIYKLKYF